MKLFNAQYQVTLYPMTCTLHLFLQCHTHQAATSQACSSLWDLSTHGWQSEGPLKGDFSSCYTDISAVFSYFEGRMVYKICYSNLCDSLIWWSQPCFGKSKETYALIYANVCLQEEFFTLNTWIVVLYTWNLSNTWIWSEICLCVNLTIESSYSFTANAILTDSGHLIQFYNLRMFACCETERYGREQDTIYGATLVPRALFDQVSKLQVSFSHSVTLQQKKYEWLQFVIWCKWL